VSVRAKFTPGSGTLTAYLAPFSGKTSCAHYGLFVTQAGEVWVTILAENGLARLDVKVPARCPRQAPLLCCSSAAC